ncbi:hypothetical protein L211DRAFT_579853 [Terfezia boudieri ATCC MYA-4762]|uniref:Secreted protein n=1 Tax=Terfezia boudieri ATCC MYA-4762 TaxID=1051890 RepID=A0A3N4LES8_9PEZI|nr:hypothetical protein L211DRAFT_579853 [Terfezia boudieri ATCC MYA-4762]
MTSTAFSKACLFLLLLFRTLQLNSPFKSWLILLVRRKKGLDIISRSIRFKHHLRTSGFQLPLPQLPRLVLLLIDFLCI